MGAKIWSFAVIIVYILMIKNVYVQILNYQGLPFQSLMRKYVIATSRGGKKDMEIMEGKA